MLVRKLLMTITIGSISLQLIAADEFSFDISSYEKKPYEFGGYVELVADRQRLNADSGAYKLNALSLADRSIINHQAATVELTGQYANRNWQASFNAHANAERDNLENDEDAKIYEAILAYKPNPGFTFELGKKALKWGKGYAWNPVAFVERPKNPDEPDLSREGHTMATVDIIKSYSGDLKTIAITPVYLPVNKNVNKDYGNLNHNNVAVKLYFLYKDTDIDLAYLSEGSRSHRFGFDFARNITTNFEVHGEWAYLSNITKSVVDNAGTITTEQTSARQWLLGLRYLTKSDTTLIAEYYNNQSGYSEKQMSGFFEVVHAATVAANTTLLNQLSAISQQTYLKRNPGKHYLYLRLSNKEPFDWLYFTPTITLITNLDDQSYSAAPELIYTRIKDLELRFKASWFKGKPNTEFGEKRNDQKVEFRLRYYF